MKPGWLLYISGLYSQIHRIRSDMQIQSENDVVLGSVILSEPPEEFKKKQIQILLLRQSDQDPTPKKARIRMRLDINNRKSVFSLNIYL